MLIIWVEWKDTQFNLQAESNMNLIITLHIFAVDYVNVWDKTFMMTKYRD